MGSYLRDNSWKDPLTGKRYVLAISGGTANSYKNLVDNLEVGQIASDSGAGCDQNGRPIDYSPGGDPRQQFQTNITTKLESGDVYCTSNRQVPR